MTSCSPSVNFVTEIFSLNWGDVWPDWRVLSLQCSYWFDFWAQFRLQEGPGMCRLSSLLFCPAGLVFVFLCVFFKPKEGH